METRSEGSKAKPPSGFGKDVNQYLNHYVNVADAKAAGILTADLTIGGYIMPKVPVTLLAASISLGPL